MTRTRRRQREPSPDICIPPKEARLSSLSVSNHAIEQLESSLVLESSTSYGVEIPIPSASVPQRKGFAYEDLFPSHKDHNVYHPTYYNDVNDVYTTNPPDPFLISERLNDTSLCNEDSINTPPHRSPSPILTLSPMSSADPDTPPMIHSEIAPSPVCDDPELTERRERSKSDYQIHLQSALKGTSPDTPIASTSALRKGRSAGKKTRLSYAEGDSLVTVHTYSELETDTEPSYKLPPTLPSKLTDDYHRPGKIYRMQLINFMCHEKFDKKWNPMVNFFTGENGSGKSAIVNAIILNLGGTAKMTERVDQVCSFIMTGRQYAKIDITYTNDGTLPLQKYGYLFTISRTIRYKKNANQPDQDNNKKMKYESTYKISTPDKNTKWRKLKRNELNLIKLTLQIMVENPAMFLTQENSRNFGKEKDPERLYQIYYKGMSLEPSERYYLNATSNIQMSRGLLDAKKKILEGMALKAKRLSEEYELIKKLENKTGARKQLELEYSWALVTHAESKENILRKKLDANELECNKLLDEIEKIKDEQKSFEAARSGREALKANMVKKLTAKRVEEETCRHKCRSINNQTGPFQFELKNIDDQIKKVILQIRECEEKIQTAKSKSESEQKRIQDEANAQKERLVERKEDLRKKILNEQKAKEENDNKLKVVQDSLRELREKDTEAKTALRKKNAELKGIQEKKSSKFSRFGSKMEHLIKLIDQYVREGKFRDPPRGPQAAYYTVKENYKQFTPLIEFILAGTLFQFRVTNQEDLDLMNKLIRQVFGKKTDNTKQVYPSLTLHALRNNEKFNLIKMVNKNRERFDTVLDALDILDNDPITINWLVDTNGVERKLLFETNADACEVMKERHRVPAGCECAYTAQNFRVVHQPSYSIRPSYAKQKASYVQVTTKLKNDELVKAEIKELEQECRAISESKRVKEKECEILRKVASEHDRNLKNWTTEQIKLEAEILNIMTEVNKLPDLVSFETQAEELREFLAQQETIKINVQAKLKKIIPQQEIMEQERVRLGDEIFNLESEISSLEADEDNDLTPNDLVVELKRKTEILKRRKLISEASIKELKEMDAEIQKKTKEALTKGARVHSNRDPKEIDQELKELNELLKRNRHKICQKQKIKEEMDSTRKVAEKIESDMNVVKKLIRILEPMLQVQSKQFELTKRNSGQSLQASYHSLITSRSYKGELILNHQKRTLDFYVAPDDLAYKKAQSIRSNEKVMSKYEENSQKSKIKDNNRSFSGGERSFGTICFMVSMWKIMEVPFIVQDEFDIFMDAVNREIVQQILIDHTMNQPEAQFSFFTPLGLDFDCPSNTTIWRLFPPVRKDNADNEQQTQMNIFEESGSSARKSGAVDEYDGLMPTLEKQIDDRDEESPKSPVPPKRTRKRKQ